MKNYLAATIGMSLLLLPGSVALAQQPTVQERVVALKASLAASQALLKPYEWVETTVVSLKGDEKSRQMNRCYHGADGKVQKVPLTTPPPAEKKRGLRGLIVENKKEELTDTMKGAVALVKGYMPPQPTLIQKAKDAGKVTLQPLSGQRVRLTFTDYLKPGDSLALEVDLASNRPLGAKISSYLDSKKEPVTLDVRFNVLDNNATYASDITLNTPAKDLTVNVQYSGYRRM
ncbi:MAG: hypothetical protein KJ072_16815 [Verrucomicrobia bacterium]|nr:hypothetical protein [Verrucomicrobiota bacterium]